MLQRRGFLTGLWSALVCAPAIVRASSLMPVKAVAVDNSAAIMALLNRRMAEAERALIENINASFFLAPTSTGGFRGLSHGF